MRLSYSSRKLLASCEKRYVFEKKAKYPIDPDADNDTIAFRYGKAYHSVLENTHHRREEFSLEMLDRALMEQDLNDIGSINIRYGVYACLMQYYTLREKSKLQLVHAEMEVGIPDEIVGYIDGVLTDVNGYWWLLDLKTSSTDSPAMLARIPRDAQLNLYAAFADQVAAFLGLDLNKFMGVRYNTVVKPRNVIRNGESLDSYHERSKPKIYEAKIVKEEMNPLLALADIMQARERAIALTEENAVCNFESCYSYFRPCPYWSRCYGRTYTEGLQATPVYSEVSMTDQTIEEEIF